MATCPNCGKAYKPGEEICPSCGLVFPFTTDTIASGTVLQGRYEIERLYHAGGMGYVYLARDKKLYDRTCIVKQVKEPVRNEVDRKKLEEEALRMSRLNHTGIAMILDHFIEGGYYYLVVERIQGKTLSEVFEERQGRLTEEEVVKWAIAMCEVVEYIHREGVIHRDISPDNVMLTEDGHIKFIDFGTLREFRHIAIQGTAGMGKYGYTPPEQWQGKPVAQSDIFALGATIYYLLSGNLPLSREYKSGQGPQKTDFRPEFAPIRMKNPAISPQLEAVLQRALQLDFDERCSSTSEMGRALSELGKAEVGTVSRVPLGMETAVATDIKVPAKSAHIPVGKAVSNKTRNLVLALGVLVLAVVITAGAVEIEQQMKYPAPVAEGKPVANPAGTMPNSVSMLKQSDWPMSDGNVAGTRYTPDSPPKNLKTIWEKESDMPWSYLIVSGDKLIGLPTNFVDSEKRALTCSNAETGELIWKHDVICTYAKFSSASKTRVFFNGSSYSKVDSSIICFDIATGKIVWEKAGQATTMLLPIGNKLYYGNISNAGVYCLDTATGNTVWETDDYFPNSGVIEIVADGGWVFAMDGNYRVSGIDGTTGKILWQSQPGAGNAYYNHAMLAGDNKVYAFYSPPSNTHGHQVTVVCLNANTGEEVWAKSMGSYSIESVKPALGRGKLIICGEDSISCLDAGSGKLLWLNKVDNSKICETRLPVIADKIVITSKAYQDSSSRCKTVYLDIETGKTIKELESPAFACVLANGRFYGLFGNSVLLCLGE